jgi:hypothetical protein
MDILLRVRKDNLLDVDIRREFALFPFNVPPKNYPRNNDDRLFKTCALRTIFIYRALTEHDKLDGTLSSRSCAPCQVLTEPKARSIPGQGLTPKSECALHSNGTPWV